MYGLWKNKNFTEKNCDMKKKKKKERTNALDMKEYFTSGQFNLYELHLSVVFSLICPD